MFFNFNICSLLSLLFLFNSCEAHTNQICTSTGGDGSTCGSAKFFLTTYHGCPSSGSTPGQLYIQTPVGDVHSFSFSSFCPMSGFQGPGPGATLPLNQECSQELKNKCQNVNAYVTCYYRPDGVNMISAQGEETCLAGNTQTYNCAYYATINNAITGNYIVWTTGTDANLDPCTGGQNPTGKIPCDFTSSNKVTISLAIEGCGSSCNGSPPTPSGVDSHSQTSWTANVDLNSCSLGYDGIQCSVSCPSGFSQSGSLYCDDGNWVNSFVCVDQNYLNYCHSGSDCSGNGVTTDTNRQDGCDCTCNSGYIGTDCSITAPTPTNSPSLSPTPPPTPAPTPNPTLEPTTSPTSSPTGSPTSSPTGSPTSSPTGSPTSSPTGSPTITKPDNSKDDDENKNLIYVYIFVPLSIFILLLLLLLFLYRRKKENEEENDIEENKDENVAENEDENEAENKDENEEENEYEDKNEEEYEKEYEEEDEEKDEEQDSLKESII